MNKCYFLVDNILQSPYSGITFELPGEKNHRPLDLILGHFDGFSYNNFYHVNQIGLLDTAPKYILNVIHMPEWVDIEPSAKTITLLKNDPTVFYCLISVTECRLRTKQLRAEIDKHGIPHDKVVVLCCDVEAHNKTLDGIKYITVNYWESVSIHQHKTLPNVAITLPDELDIDNASKKFLCLNRNIKPHRIWLMYSILKSGVLDQGHVSYNLPDVSKQEHDECAKSYHTVKRIPAELHADYKMSLLRQMYTRKLDELNKAQVINYGDSIKSYYNDSLTSVITESDSTKNFITEKTYKAIMNLHPFFIVGNPEQHSLLRARGYETFEELFGVDCVMDYNQATTLWQKINAMDIDILKRQIKEKYIDKLLHNQRLFLSRKVSWDKIVDNIIEITH